MHLKKIEIKGFKSFPDKTEIFFPKGLISVVGPNGSGKSNILDATRWVLGEQSMKSLRGEKLEDVIFSGTEKRKEMNHCEVSLLIDNTDQKIDIDYSEVEIKRKAFKSGESQFFINNKPCRLKDIKELLLDTGIGREGYSIISQGKVDELVDGNPVHRRKVLEEAAGITKYRYRKEESQKKLESTKENLERICDIYYEIERQVKPLSEQKIKAERFLSLKEQLLRSDVNRLLLEFEELSKKRTILEERFHDLTHQISRNNDRKQEIMTEEAELQSRIEKLKSKTQQIKQQITDLETDIHAQTKEKAVLEERRENLILSLDKAKNAKAKTKDEIKLQKEKNTETEDSMTQLYEKLEILDREYSEKNASYQETKAQLEELEKDLENSRSMIVEWLNYQSSVKTKSEFLKERIQKNTQEFEDISDELNNTDSALQDIHAKKSIAENHIQALQEKTKNCQEDLEALQSKITNYDKEIKNTEDHIYRLKNTERDFLSKIDILTKLDEDMEGISRGAKELVRSAPVHGIINIVANIVKVNPGYEKAIEVALGGSLQHVIVENTSVAKECIRYLKEKNFGRVTFLPADTIVASPMKYDDIGILASNCVSYPESLTNIVEYLLGKVVVVNTIEEAISISKKYNHRFKIVTIAGEIFHIGGSITGGSSFHSAGVFTRRKSIQNDKEQLQKIRQELEILKDALQTKEKDKNLCLSESNKLSEEYLLLERKIQSENEYINQWIVQIQYEEEAKKKLFHHYEQALKQKEEDRMTLEECTQEIDHYEAKLTQLKEKTGEIIRSKETIEKESSTKEESIQSFRVEKARLSEIIISTENEKKIRTQHLSKLEEELLTLEKEEHQNQELLYHLTSDVQNIDSGIEHSQNQKTALQGEISDIEKETIPHTNQMLLLQKELKNLDQEMIQQNTHKIKLDSEQERLEDQTQNISEKLSEDYQMDLSKAYSLLDPSIDTSKKHIESLRYEMLSMGNVNLDAIEEFARINERYELYKAQKNDLEKSVETIEALIQDLEKNMIIEFAKSFKEINERFREVFKVLFGGGHGELILSDENDLLSASIDINVQPPGKKLKSISALSGGEKALSAIAILFAILIRKPVPFCILDEIDAPLDDANIYRFVHLLRELSNDTQFLMITHRRGTMEFSDYIYGVAMQENGISKIISLQLEEAQNYIE